MCRCVWFYRARPCLGSRTRRRASRRQSARQPPRSLRSTSRSVGIRCGLATGSPPSLVQLPSRRVPRRMRSSAKGLPAARQRDLVRRRRDGPRRSARSGPLGHHAFLRLTLPSWRGGAQLQPGLLASCGSGSCPTRCLRVGIHARLTTLPGKRVTHRVLRASQKPIPSNPLWRFMFAGRISATRRLCGF